MIDHISIGVSDLEKSIAFYQAALTPLGYELKFEMPQAICFGSENGDSLWIGVGEVGKTHIAFAADRAAVNAFYEAGIAAGGMDNGAPGLRPQYHENYYAAFLFDPDGYNIEAVCRTPED